MSQSSAAPVVERVLKRHDEFAEITDPVTSDVLRWLESQRG
ncbi:hypothetical protein ABZ490_26460 [Streptomyces sp. NPDC005811]